MYAKSMIKYVLGIVAFCFFTLPLGAHATTYYIDFSCNTPGNGTTPTCNGDADDSYQNLDAFTEAARSAGDIAIARRGMASTTNVSDVGFTSDGATTNPIVLTADYVDAWGDFASSTQTYTPVPASKTMTANASISDISAGDWVFVDGDDGTKFAYEVRSVSGTTLEFWLPYKGPSTGSGKTLNIMPSAPEWNVAAGAFQFSVSTDNDWWIKGLSLKGADTNGVVQIDSTDSVAFSDMIFESNGNSIVEFSSDQSVSRWDKIRTINSAPFYSIGSSYVGGEIYLYDSYVQSFALILGNVYMENVETYITSATSLFNTSSSGSQPSWIVARNLQASSTGSGFFGTVDDETTLRVEDVDGVIGSNIWFSGLMNNDTESTESDFILTSTSTVLRAGGGPSSVYVTPKVQGPLPTRWLKLFEYPIYADTSSKTYEVYFRSDATGDWSADPTASELWIACDYWANTGGSNQRMRKVSTGVVDFNGTTDWQSLSVTCQPTASGVLYLSAWYAKPKEAGTNEFFIDGTPVIN